MHVRRTVLAVAAATLTVATAVAVAAAPAQSTTRTIRQFTEDWHFILGDPAGAQQPGFDEGACFDEGAWKTVTLPHDWAIAGPVDQNAPTRSAGGFFPAGVGWYRKSFTVPARDAKPTAVRPTFIVFDGVMANSDAYVNGQFLGHRPYGYVSFVYELTP